MRAGALTNSRDPDGFDNMAGAGDARLALVHAAHPLVTTAAVLAHERTLPVVDALSAVVPSGHLQRGSNLAVNGVGATSFALALAGEAVRGGSFLAIVAPPSFGLEACIDFDIPLRRVVQFSLADSALADSALADSALADSALADSALADSALWSQVVAAVIEGFDIVMLANVPRVSASQTRQLVARNRERGSVLVRVGGPAWSDAADVRFDVNNPVWSGLGAGHGHLQSRQVSVQVAGRRHPGAPRTHQLLLPAIDGGVQVPASAAVPGTAALGGNAERFAGSDIDQMLNVVDGGVIDGGVDEVGVVAAGDLGAIA